MARSSTAQGTANREPMEKEKRTHAGRRAGTVSMVGGARKAVRQEWSRRAGPERTPD